MASKVRAWRGLGAAMALPAIAARAVTTREADESFIVCLVGLEGIQDGFVVDLGFRDQLQM